MDLSVAIRATAIEGPDVQRPTSQSRMPGQHVNMALLAQQMDASSQKLGMIRTVRRVTVHAVLASRWMLPKKRTTFFGMAGVADIIGCGLDKHLAAPATMRAVAGGAAYLCVAKLGAKQETELDVQYFLGPHDNQHGRVFKRKVKGPREGDYSFTENIGAGQMKRVGCGAAAVLEVGITLSLSGDLKTGEAMASLDTTDAAPGGALVYHLNLKKCS